MHGAKSVNAHSGTQIGNTMAKKHSHISTDQCMLPWVTWLSSKPLPGSALVFKKPGDGDSNKATNISPDLFITAATIKSVERRLS